MFRVENLFSDVPVYNDDGHTLKVYDNPKYARIVERYSENGVKYVVVMFDRPNNPPSNQTRYIYLAP